MSKNKQRCVKQFNSAVEVLMSLDGCERKLLDWILLNMTSENLITNNLITRANFIAYYSKYKKPANKGYSDKTVSISFQRLSSDGILIPVTRGMFQVNLKYFKA